MNAIITASELASELAGERPPVVLDIRWQLSVAKAAGAPEFDGRAAYAAGHIPSAVFIDLDRELAGTAGPGEGRHPLPDLAAFGAAMRAAGVSADRDVVVYDGGQGWAAARAWWLLRWTGHSSVRVLDGGLAAWDGSLETSVPTVRPGTFAPAPGATGLLDADDAAALARSGLLLDARAAERYRGDVEPIDRVGGHIPGAVSAPTTENVADDGRFRPAAELAERFKSLGATGDPGQVGVYCGSGVSGAHEVLALAVAGFDAQLYVGSWSQWSADESRPVATGPDPQ
ncbi:sulfurtransferase [Streptomyces sp. SID8379]|uniref:sulfurtransferase n=1 Tax=unclassified Streptomyces TaxID=2593676 RepID=UPI00039DA65E|nr:MULTISPECIES: sulfurtransferase [unclassified Streptomyces]MYW67315.1 sulfurtransferase [Streptomyces sp. SID8379]